MKKNKLNVEVTRPTQILIIMRGIPGSGKSTKAKTLVGDGIIHSTDDVIESKHDYNEFFQKMKDSNDWTNLSRAHSTNLKNAIKSMKSDKTPIIIDNTNIAQNDAKAYVVAALNLGFADENIKVVDIGTNGLTAIQLAERNAHGVPLEKINAMISSHKAQGEMTLESILDSKDRFKPSDVLYSAAVLITPSRTLLLENVGEFIPEDWKVIAHHMTICLGPLKDKAIIGKKAILTVTHLGFSDMAMAVKVMSDVPTKNEIPHITIAINPDGGKPVMSNEITKWREIKKFDVMTDITEIKADKQILTQKPK